MRDSASANVSHDAILEMILHRLTDLDSRVSDLSEKLHDLLAQLAYTRDDLTGAADEVHRVLADEIGTFVGQKLLALSYTAVQHTHRNGYTKKRLAQTMSKLCSAYLAPAGVELGRARRILRARKGDEVWQTAGQAALQVKKILDTARSRGIEFVWDYEFTAGMPIDETRQQAWSNCDPDSDVSFVVVPGYIAGGECYRLQEVFTEGAAS
ncbi:hypothetical protein [Streptomyces sp. NPDC085596]|uniref:hypothetical protein n=1 Tax=Streptomyces sp. NPDC085596 TaxID=3365731 RepID=UPI0037CE5BC3